MGIDLSFKFSKSSLKLYISQTKNSEIRLKFLAKGSQKIHNIGSSYFGKLLGEIQNIQSKPFKNNFFHDH